MKKILFFLTLLTTTSILFGQKRHPFSDFGYPIEPIVMGREAEQSFYFKTDNNLDITNSYVHLEVRCSQVIDRETSYITIIAGEEALESRYITNEKEILAFDIPLKSRYIESGYLKLTIKTDLVIEGETCKDFSYNGYWVKLTEYSFISMAEIPNIKTALFNTVSELAPQIKSIILPEIPTINDIQYASYIKFYFERVYGNKINVKSINTLKDSLLDRSIILFPKEAYTGKIRFEIPKEEENNGIVSLFRDVKEIDSTDILIGQNIIVTGANDESYKKATHYMLQKNLINSAFTDKIYVDRSTKLFDTPTRKNFKPIYFNELDADTKIVRGVGSLSKNVILPRYYFGSNVKKMETRIEGKYRPVADNEEVYLNLYFNGKLLRTYQLNNSGDLDFSFEFDGIEMQQENTFTYEFYHVPEGGYCDVDAFFYAQIDTQKSYFKPIGYEDSESLAFANFPENFQSNPLSIYIDNLNHPDIINGLSELIDIINPGEAGLQGFIYPKINTAEVETLANDKTSGKIIISENYSKFDSIYKKEPFITFNSQHNVKIRSEAISPFFNLNYDDTFGYNQLFYSGKLPIMLINVPNGIYDNTLKTLITSIKEQVVTKTGNVIISKGDNSYYFDLRNNSKKESSSQLGDLFDGYWSTYGLLIVILIFIISLLLLIYIYKKSQSSKKSVQ